VQLLVGIPTHRRPELLRKCLASIAAQQGRLPSVSVFVADNDPAGREGVKLVEELSGSYRFPLSATLVERPGISAVRNAILAEARRTGSDFIAMMDDDEVASEHWLDGMLKVQAACDADVVGGLTIRHAPAAAPRWLQTAEAYSMPPRPTGPIDFINSTSNVVLRCASLERAQWPQFDHAFGLSGGGDTEFFLRLKKAGFKFAWASEASVDEPIPPARFTMSWFFRRQFRYGNTGYQLKRLHGYEVMPGLKWAIRQLVASPALIFLSLFPAYRLKALKRLAFSTGILSSALGYRYLEYAERHRSNTSDRDLS
jgi:succinoglycan biosynthesis protein ExoM